MKKLLKERMSTTGTPPRDCDNRDTDDDHTCKQFPSEIGETPPTVCHDNDHSDHGDRDEDNEPTVRTVASQLLTMDSDTNSDDAEDNSDCSVFDYLEATDDDAGIGQKTHDKVRPVGGKEEPPLPSPRSGLEKYVQKIPGYRKLCKEMKSDDPLEIGFYLWQRQETNEKYFSFLRKKCEYVD